MQIEVLSCFKNAIDTRKKVFDTLINTLRTNPDKIVCWDFFCLYFCNRIKHKKIKIMARKDLNTDNAFQVKEQKVGKLDNVLLKQGITTINYHLTKKCNFKCKYCFARFNDIEGTSMLQEEESLRLIKMLANSGRFDKINFAGGEPFLAPHLANLIKCAKEYGLKTSVVTNGSKLSPNMIEQMAKYLDILAISIDSINRETNTSMGNFISLEKLPLIIKSIHRWNIKLKINTVVSSFNKNESLTAFINEIKPFRWKILQVTRIKGQNDEDFNEVAVSKAEFESFLNRNKIGLIPDIKVIGETENMMIGSYCMVDCKGRFFDNSLETHRYSAPILEIGVENALKQIENSYDKFIERNGKY